MSKRVIIWCVSIVSALLIAVIVALVVLIATLAKQADDAAYTACVQRLTAGATTVSQVADAAEFCSK